MSEPTQDPRPAPAQKPITRRRFIQGGAMAGASALVLPALSKAGGLRMRAGASKTQLTLMGLFFIPSELAAAREIINEFNAQSKTIHVQYVQSSWGAIGSK